MHPENVRLGIIKIDGMSQNNWILCNMCEELDVILHPGDFFRRIAPSPSKYPRINAHCNSWFCKPGNCNFFPGVMLKWLQTSLTIFVEQNKSEIIDSVFCLMGMWQSIISLILSKQFKSFWCISIAMIPDELFNPPLAIHPKVYALPSVLIMENISSSIWYLTLGFKRPENFKNREQYKHIYFPSFRFFVLRIALNSWIVSFRHLSEIWNSHVVSTFWWKFSEKDPAFVDTLSNDGYSSIARIFIYLFINYLIEKTFHFYYVNTINLISFRNLDFQSFSGKYCDTGIRILQTSPFREFDRINLGKGNIFNTE